MPDVQSCWQSMFGALRRNKSLTVCVWPRPRGEKEVQMGEERFKCEDELIEDQYLLSQEQFEKLAGGVMEQIEKYSLERNGN